MLVTKNRDSHQFEIEKMESEIFSVTTILIANITFCIEHMPKRYVVCALSDCCVRILNFIPSQMEAMSTQPIGPALRHSLGVSISGCLMGVTVAYSAGALDDMEDDFFLEKPSTTQSMIFSVSDYSSLYWLVELAFVYDYLAFDLGKGFMNFIDMFSLKTVSLNNKWTKLGVML